MERGRHWALYKAWKAQGVDRCSPKPSLILDPGRRFLLFDRDRPIISLFEEAGQQLPLN